LADQKLTELTATTSVSTSDVLYIVTNVVSTATSNKVTFDTLNNAVVIVETQVSLSDNTTANASTTKHGLLPKLSGVSTQFLNGEGVFAVPAGGGTSVSDVNVVFTDNATNNASTSAHGFLPKLSGVSTQYLNGEGVFSVPAGGGASATEAVFTNGDLTAGILTVTHNAGLSSKFTALAQVINNSGSMVIPDEINTFSTNSFKVDLSSYGTIAGDWACIYVVKG
jgi:hypothetical protein